MDVRRLDRGRRDRGGRGDRRIVGLGWIRGVVGEGGLHSSTRDDWAGVVASVAALHNSATDQAMVDHVRLALDDMMANLAHALVAVVNDAAAFLMMDDV